MGDWAARIAQLRERWDRLSLAIRVAIAAGLLVAVGGIAFAATANREPHKAVLFSNLSDDDAARIVDKLRSSNIPYAFGEGNTTLLVPEAQVHETRLMLASEGLPSGGGVGFEVFDQQRFGESEFSEQVKYHRALEGELARTISHLAGVKSARVHLVLPARSLFADREQDASASVVVHLVPGWKMREDQVKGIIHLVASSVRGLDPEHVTLVDGDGRPLERPESREENGGELSNKADAYRREIERGKERAAQQMLDASLGHGKSMVRVAAAVNFAREEVTEELYDPETIAQRSFQIIEERDGAGNKTVTGLPGTPSNLPGGEAAVVAPGGGAGLSRRSETRNYEVSKYMRRAVEPVGRVTGMQVAVVADGRYKGTGEKKKFEALSKDELERIQKLVAGAVGIDEKRGDRVVVECIPFAPAATPLDDRTIFEKALGPYTPYVLWALLVVAAFLAYRVLNKALLKSRAADGGAGALTAGGVNAQALPGGLGMQNAALPSGDTGLLEGLQLGGALGDRAEHALAGGAGAGDTTQAADGGGDAGLGEHAAEAPVLKPVIPKSLLNRSKEPNPDAEAIEQVRKLAEEMASKEPEAAARVLRGWLADSKEKAL